MSVEVAQQLQYQKESKICPNYEMVKLVSNVGTELTIQQNSTTDAVFEIPAIVHNLAESVISCKVTITATAAKVHHIYANCLSPVYQIQLYDASNTMLCDVQNVEHYTSMAWGAFTPFDDFINFDKLTDNSIATNSSYHSLMGPANTTSVKIQNQNADLSAALGIINPAYLISAATTNEAYPVLNLQIKLGRILHSILNYNKDVFFGRIMYLRIVFNNINAIVFDSNALTTPVTGAALAGKNATLNNLYLYLAAEKNLAISEEIKMKYVNGGLTYHFDDVRGYKYTFGAGNGVLQSIMLKLNRYHGQKLKYVIWAPYNSTEQTTSNYVRTVDSAGTVETDNFYTQMDQVRLTQFNIAMSTYNDWLLQKDKFKNSCILSAAAYREAQWVWIDDWTGNEPYSKKKHHEDCGLDLSLEKEYQIYATTGTGGSARSYYIYVVCLKSLLVSPQILQFV